MSLYKTILQGYKAAIMSEDPVITTINREHMDITKKINSNDCTKTILIDAAINSNLHAVGYLLSRGVDIHTRKDEALISLCRHGYLEMLIRISTMEMSEYYDINRIKELAFKVNTRLIRYLLSPDRRADVSAQGGYALIVASYSQSMEVFEMLADIYGDICDLLPTISPKARKHLSKYRISYCEGSHLSKLISRYY